MEYQNNVGTRFFCDILSYQCRNDVFEDALETLEENSMTRTSAKMSHLCLIPSQFPKLVDQTNCRMSFLGVFPRYLELPMSE